MTPLAPRGASVRARLVAGALLAAGALSGGGGCGTSGATAGAGAAPPVVPVAPDRPTALPAAPTPPPAPSPELSLLPACAGDKWLWNTPSNDADWIYGVGDGPSSEAARNSALSDAAARREVTIRSELRDRQVDWQTQSKASDPRAGGYSQNVVEESRASAEGRFRSCDAQQMCADRVGRAHALVRCIRPGRELERELIEAGATVGKAVPKDASLILIPATDDGETVTQLGEYASRILRHAIDDKLPPGARLLTIPPWNPADLQQVARHHKATHAIQGEHVPAGGSRLLFRVWLIDLASEQPVPHSEASFQIDLEPEEQDMLSVRGPLFPSKDSLALAENHGLPLPVRVLQPNIREGDSVQVEFTLPVDSYAYLFDLYEDGRATLLIPNPEITNNRFPGRVRTIIPDDGWQRHSLSIVACPIPGHEVTREDLKLIASPTPLDFDFAHFSGPDMATLQGGPAGKIKEVRAALDRLHAEGVPIREGLASYVIHAVPGPTICKGTGGQN
jgi:hypothetical protein